MSMTMTVSRWAVRVHKWVALVVGVQILLWVLGGLVMSAIPIERVRGEHKIARASASALPVGELIPLEQASAVAPGGLSEARLMRVADRPVWRLESPRHGVVLVDARDGTVLSPVDEALARRIAELDYAGPGALAAVSRLEAPPAEAGHRAPVWQARFDDGDDTTLYVAAATGEVVARRSATWRFYDLFWRLHVMDYDDGADFNHPLLITAAGAAVITALTGIVLLYVRMRRSLLIVINRRRDGPA